MFCYKQKIDTSVENVKREEEVPGMDFVIYGSLFCLLQKVHAGCSKQRFWPAFNLRVQNSTAGIGPQPTFRGEKIKQRLMPKLKLKLKPKQMTKILMIFHTILKKLNRCYNLFNSY